MSYFERNILVQSNRIYIGSSYTLGDFNSFVDFLPTNCSIYTFIHISSTTYYKDVTSIIPSNATTTLTQQQTSLPNITNAVSHTIVQHVMPQTITSVVYPCNAQTEVNLPDSTISPPTQDNSTIQRCNVSKLC
ncbi:uncharacterized protein LOC119614061 [Lucilia sericata]|uniref:uncharacterized protein LOC119614061 n=1 Tax=Lucilia sericata TaxID=13632 RepID=UPI0018A86554|nr:uncharacterized protein LOC119614061 [Lucilia sericata]